MKQNQPDRNHLHYGMPLKLYFEDEAFGPGMSALLRGVEETGPLQRAVQGMNMAYSRAWKISKEPRKAWRFPLTERETGGKDGGGSTPTAQVAQLPGAYDFFMEETREGLGRLLEKYSSRDRIERLKNNQMSPFAGTYNKEEGA